MNGKNFLFFLYILDTGGWLFVRPIVIVAYTLRMFAAKHIKVMPSQMALWILMVLLMIPSSINATEQGVDFLTVTSYIIPILVIPIYLLISSALNLNSKTLVDAAVFFSAFVVSAFVLRLLGVGFVESFFEYLKANPNAGFFDEKSAFTAEALPGVYFKATLLLVPFGVLAAYGRRWITLVLVLLALTVAPSRTGVIVLLLFIFPLSLRGDRKFLKISISVALISSIASYVYLASDDVVSDFFLGGSTRFLHIISMQEYFAENPEYFFLGGGPGTTFYSYAFANQASGGYTDDSEISQLEILRRYGIFFLIYICMLYLIAVRKLFRIGLYGEGFALISYFVVSASNPVLLTAPACFYYAVVANIIAKHRQRPKDRSVQSPSITGFVSFADAVHSNKSSLS